MEFFVMNTYSPYNAILGEIGWGRLRQLPPHFIKKLKFPSPKGVVVVRSKQEDAHYYFNLVIMGSLSEKPLE